METIVHVIVVPEAEWKLLQTNQQEIVRMLKEIRNTTPQSGMTIPYITAMEFMQTVRVGRMKFDQLAQANKVKTIKKDRKIYVPVGELERYFRS